MPLRFFIHRGLPFREQLAKSGDFASTTTQQKCLSESILCFTNISGGRDKRNRNFPTKVSTLPSWTDALGSPKALGVNGGLQRGRESGV